MNTDNTTRDKNGVCVKEGDTVRVLSCPTDVMAKLPAEEQKDVMSMVGRDYVVEEVDEHGSAWVTAWWVRGEDRKESHSLGLSPDEMEVVNGGSSR